MVRHGLVDICQLRHQRDSEDICMNEVLLYVNRIIEEFDDICDNNISINMYTFFDRYNLCLHNYGLDWVVICLVNAVSEQKIVANII